MIWGVLLACAIAWLASLALTPRAAALAWRLGVVKHPGGRHVHQRSTPLWGGLAMYVAFWGALAIGALVMHPSASAFGARVWGVALGSLLLVVVSAYDDWRPLSPWFRLAVHVAAAAIAFLGGARIDVVSHPGNAHAYVYLRSLAAPATILWIVVLTNALNWIDGLDGLAAGVTAIVATTLAILALLLAGLAGSATVALGGAALVGACLGFLRYNFSPARVFMGDAGAMFLGYALACLSVLGAFKTATVMSFGIPLLIFCPIWGDAARTFFRRLWRRGSAVEADQGHWHHRLLQRGLSKNAAVVQIYLWTALPCALAIGLFAVLR